MSRKAETETKQEELDCYLENPPTDRTLDCFWSDNAHGPSQRARQWPIACRGGTVSAIAGEIPGMVAEHNQAREALEIYTARLMKPEAAEARHRGAALEERIGQLKIIVAAAGGRIETDERGKVTVKGGWIDADQRALDRAVGDATFAVEEARGKVALYRGTWPPIPDFEKRFAAELKEEARAEAALTAARKAAADNLALLETDRAELAKLRSRRVA